MPKTDAGRKPKKLWLKMPAKKNAGSGFDFFSPFSLSKEQIVYKTFKYSELLLFYGETDRAMKKVSTQKPPTLFRIVVLCAVFTGLLFSCGEGIRLIPFPAADTKKNDCSRLNFENKVPYQFNAHRFEDNQGSFKTKSQRGSQNQHWIVAGGLKDTAFRFSAARVKCCFPSASGSIKSRLFVSSGESRAPPFTI